MSKLILVRHGQSEWNLANRFTGWWDVDLTEKGETEAREAGELMLAKGVLPTLAFTSVQKRAIKTLNLALEACDRLWDVDLTEKGETVIISAHGNSLRALVKHLSNISDDEITGLEIPTGQPIIYEFDGTQVTGER